MTTAHNPQTTGKNTESRNEVRGTSNEEWKGKSHKSQVSGHKPKTSYYKLQVTDQRIKAAHSNLAHSSWDRRAEVSSDGKGGGRARGLGSWGETYLNLPTGMLT